MNMFEDIARAKKELPKVNTLSTNIKHYKYNGYQILAIVIFVVCFILGIIFGNLFPVCGSSSFYSDVCVTTEFNVFLMLVIWFVSFLVSTFFFAMGHIIALLTAINQKIK